LALNRIAYHFFDFVWTLLPLSPTTSIKTKRVKSFVSITMSYQDSSQLNSSSSNSAHPLPARPNSSIPKFTPAWQSKPAAAAPPSNNSSYQDYHQQPAQAALPVIQNPFPLPGTAPQRTYNAAEEAEIAQWQSAYANKDDTSKFIQTPHRAPIDVGSSVVPESGVAAVVAGSDGKQKTVVRSGGGKTWQDPSLLQWDPSHPRLFIGNLAGEVTDDSLLKAFAKYQSVQKARVIRDKRTSKSKGFGFVSFSSSDDYFQAAKEMQGKYIGSHPVLIKRSTTEIKAVKPQVKGGKHNNKKNNHSNQAAASDLDRTGAGIQKKPPKTKNGMKFLG
jgi:hypothetical protein